MGKARPRMLRPVRPPRSTRSSRPGDRHDCQAGTWAGRYGPRPDRCMASVRSVDDPAEGVDLEVPAAAAPPLPVRADGPRWGQHQASGAARRRCPSRWIAPRAGSRPCTWGIDAGRPPLTAVARHRPAERGVAVRRRRRPADPAGGSVLPPADRRRCDDGGDDPDRAGPTNTARTSPLMARKPACGLSARRRPAIRAAGRRARSGQSAASRASSATARRSPGRP